MTTWRAWLFGSSETLLDADAEPSEGYFRAFGNRKYRELVDSQLDKFMPFSMHRQGLNSGFPVRVTH